MSAIPGCFCLFFLVFGAESLPGDVFFQDPEPEVVSAQLGGRVVLTCEAGGSPTPTIHWLYDGERILQVLNHFFFYYVN